MDLSPFFGWKKLDNSALFYQSVRDCQLNWDLAQRFDTIRIHREKQ